MKANGGRTSETAMASSCSPMETLTKANTSKGNLTDVASTPGKMERFMKESSKWVSKRALGSGKAPKMTPISGSGSMGKLKATAFTCGKTKTNMKESGYRI